MNTQLFDQAKRLTLDEQIELVEALWDNIVERHGVPPITETQKAELDRRILDHESNPHDVVLWGEVRAEALRQIGK